MGLDLSKMTPTDLRNLMKNALPRGGHDVFRDAFRELCRREGRDADDPLDKEMSEAITALEEARRIEFGRSRPATYTKRKLANKGVHATLVDWAMHPTTTTGFELLIAHGLPELTGEAIVLRHPDRFSEEVVEAARKRLAKVGIQLDLGKSARP